jgi:hypothetical protein
MKPGYTVHIRPVLLVEHARTRKAHVVASEGHLTEFINISIDKTNSIL